MRELGYLVKEISLTDSNETTFFDPVKLRFKK